MSRSLVHPLIDWYPFECYLQVQSKSNAFIVDQVIGLQAFEAVQSSLSKLLSDQVSYPIFFHPVHSSHPWWFLLGVTLVLLRSRFLRCHTAGGYLIFFWTRSLIGVLLVFHQNACRTNQPSQMQEESSCSNCSNDSCC